MRRFASFLSGMNPTIEASSNLKTSHWSNQRSDQLTQYAGQYISDELAATDRMIVRDGQLWLRVNSRRWEQLDATVHDEFIPHIRETKLEHLAARPVHFQTLTATRRDDANAANTQ